MDTASAVLQCVILEMKKKKWKVNKHFFTDKQLQSSNETAETGGKCKWRRSCCSVICGGWDGEMILWIFRSWYDSVQLIPLKLSVHTHKHTCAHTHTHTHKKGWKCSLSAVCFSGGCIPSLTVKVSGCFRRIKILTWAQHSHSSRDYY